MPFDGKLLKERRLFLHMTQPELAHLAGLYSGVEVSRLENGHREPSLTVAANLAWAVGWTLERLVKTDNRGGIDRKQPRQVKVYEWTPGDARQEVKLRGKGRRDRSKRKALQ